MARLSDTQNASFADCIEKYINEENILKSCLMKSLILGSKRTGFMNNRVHLYLKGSQCSMAKSLH